MKSTSLLALAQFGRRSWAVALLAALSVPLSAAAQSSAVGVVTFATGNARLITPGKLGGAVVKKGDPIYAGQVIETAEAALVHVHLKDDAYLSVRPRSRLLVEAYEFDPAAPKGSKVKYTLDNGVARSITGKAGQANKSGFRFNTPVAAIGIRGTDFVVETTPDVTRAAINSGRIVMSGFGPHCSPSGLGPCGNGVAELGSRPGVLSNEYLEVRANQVKPTLVPAQPGSDSLMPRRTLVAEDASAPANAAGSDTRASASTVEVVSSAVARDVTAEPPVPPVIPVPPAPLVFWGRWSVYEGGRPDRAFAEAILDQPWATLAVVNTGFALFRDTPTVNLPDAGRFEFRLADSEAYIQSGIQLAAAQVANGRLDMDFSSRSFSTGFTLSSAQLSTAVQFDTSGTVRPDGTFFNGAANGIDVRGTLSGDTSQAGYVFRAPLDSGLTAIGATRWQR